MEPPAPCLQTQPTAAVPRLARLDGLRGLAACLVAAYHLQILYRGGLADFYGGVAGWLFTWGWAFTNLFFVISGYIFAHVYAGGAGLENGRRLGDFAVARIARLYPLHLTMLLISAVLDWGKPENTITVFLCHLFMLQGVVTGADEGFVGPSWSISVEVLCYILFALAASAGRRTLTGVAVAIVTFITVRLAMLGLPSGPWAADRVIGGLLAFFIGQLLWQCRAGLEQVPMVVLALAFAAGVLVDVGAYSPLLPLTLLAWPAAVLLVLRIRLFEAAPLLWLGDRSYGVYLIHYPVLTIFFTVLGKSHASSLHVTAVYLVFAVIVLALSDLALRTVEGPGRRAVREAWIKRRPARRMSAWNRTTSVD